MVVDGEHVAADAVVLAMGPWTALARAWLPLPPIGGLKGFSITLRPDFEVPAEMLFCEYRTAGGEVLSPEIYPRPDGEVWVCGMSDDQPVPIDPADVRVDDARCDELRRIAGTLATGLGDAEITRRQACYRPICADAMPLLGPAPGGRPGVYVATGHNCWGILNAPASGKAMAELVATGRRAASTSPPSTPPGSSRPRRASVPPAATIPPPFASGAHGLPGGSENRSPGLALAMAVFLVLELV